MVKAVPADDFSSKYFVYEGETYTVKSKFKMFKFFRLLNDNPVLALSEALEEESMARLEELDIDMDDFKKILESLSEVLAGTSAGN